MAYDTPIGPDLFGLPLMGNTAGTTGDPQADLIAKMIKALDMAPAPAPPPAPEAIGKVRRFFGGLGDAISAMGAVRAGHAPPAMGQFAAMMRERELMNQRLQEDYRKRLDTVNEANRNLRNTITMIALKPGQTIGPKDAADLARQQAALDETIRHNKAAEAQAASPRPEKEPLPHLVKNKKGFYEPVDPRTGNSLITGKPVEGPASQQAAGMPEALNNAEYLLDKMQSHYEEAVAKHSPAARMATGGAAASKNAYISGTAGYIDPDSAIHERNRNLVAVALAAPITGSRRGQQQVMDQIKTGLPSYVDNPVVAHEFYKQMHAVIANLRQAYPNGIQGGDAGDAVYLMELQDAIRTARQKAEQEAAKIGQGGVAPGTPPTEPTPDPVMDILNNFDKKKAKANAGPKP